MQFPHHDELLRIVRRHILPDDEEGNAISVDPFSGDIWHLLCLPSEQNQFTSIRRHRQYDKIGINSIIGLGFESFSAPDMSLVLQSLWRLVLL